MTYVWQERADTIYRMAREKGMTVRTRDAAPFGWQLVDDGREVAHGSLSDLDTCLQDPLIRHVTAGWTLEIDGTRCFLVRRHGCVVVKVRSTTATTCSWGVYTHDGRMLREASEHGAEIAKAEAAAWLKEHGYA